MGKKIALMQGASSHGVEVDTMIFKEWLRAHMKETGFTHSSLARATGIHERVLLGWERGRRPSDHILDEVCYQLFVGVLDQDAADYDEQWEKAKQKQGDEFKKIRGLLWDARHGVK
tara:strand:- start:1385 stop:1732 length:348 start_codon:yes stop_codon:yes gene_type:complete